LGSATLQTAKYPGHYSSPGGLRQFIKTIAFCKQIILSLTSSFPRYALVAGLDPPGSSTLKCPGQPAFETNEDFDCGEGIHLIGVDHSTVINNTSEKNSGGILLSDETGATHHNLIIGNLVRDNPFDCGITLASHSPAPAPFSTLTSPPGIYSNTIAKNESVHNGLQVPGAGAGVGLFAPGPGNKVYANVVINNELKDNGLPGVAFHNHASFPPPAPPVNLNDNVIVGNRISGNGADTDDAATPGLFHVTVGKREAQIPADRKQDDLRFKLAPLE
jgi:parallel beta-helix repeat protein